MSARILVVDDEPDLEELIRQKFRHQIRDGTIAFLFARDGVEALTVLEANHDIGLVVTDINEYADAPHSLGVLPRCDPRPRHRAGR